MGKVTFVLDDDLEEAIRECIEKNPRKYQSRSHILNWAVEQLLVEEGIIESEEEE